ncbi:hypothetical protein TWF730_003301 [Orbilia blumenaviensis]|uniref:Uncharacterized protein n=1 Tax=Orbilia blumenaviensis TaxID=1796055 RepID=A0AAV9U5Q2_9PEZI
MKRETRAEEENAHLIVGWPQKESSGGDCWNGSKGRVLKSESEIVCMEGEEEAEAEAEAAVES